MPYITSYSSRCRGISVKYFLFNTILCHIIFYYIILYNFLFDFIQFNLITLMSFNSILINCKFINIY